VNDLCIKEIFSFKYELKKTNLQIQIQIFYFSQGRVKIKLVHICNTLVKNDSIYSKKMVLHFTPTLGSGMTVIYRIGFGAVLGRGEK
jgi:hypothetical protein